jgi:hypothetical protein
MANDSRPWWSKDRKGEALREAVCSAFDAVDTPAAKLRGRMAANLGLYLGRKIDSLDSVSWTLDGATYGGSRGGENIIRAAVEAFCAKFGSNRPRPRFLTEGGDYALAKASHQIQLFVSGVIDAEGVYPKSREIMRDGMLWPVAMLKIVADPDEGRVCVERVLRSEIAVDPQDARYGKPRSMFQHKVCARAVLLASFPKAKEAIEAAGLLRGIERGDMQHVDDPVSVLEAWHLPSGPGAKDGRRVVCVNRGEPLVDAPWTRRRFPFACWRWSTAGLGWDGVPAIDDLIPFQQTHDYLTTRINTIIEGTKRRIALEAGSKVDVDELEGDDEDTVFHYKGQPPIFSDDPGPPPALLAERERNKAAAFEQLGLSMLLAQSQIPTQLDSRPAQMEYKDTESERFKDKGQAWEEFFCGDGGVADLIMDAADDLGAGYVVQAPDGDVTRAIRWGDISGARKDARMSIQPASFLPSTAAGKIAVIQQMAAIGGIPPPVLIRLLNHPDIEAAASSMTAPVDAILADIEALEDGKTVQPEPYLDLETAKALALVHYNKLRAAGADEEKLQAFRDYLQRVQEMLAQTVVAAGQVAAAGAPEAVASAALSTPGIQMAPPAGPAGMPEGMPAGDAAGLPPM